MKFEPKRFIPLVFLRDMEQQMCHWNGSWESAKYIDLRFILFYGVLGRCVGFPGKALPGKSAIIGVIRLDSSNVAVNKMGQRNKGNCRTLIFFDRLVTLMWVG